MVAVVAGNGLGLFNASLNILGGAGVLGQAEAGQAGCRCYVNVATGNLVLRAYDERLSGRGLDLQHVRTHNSLGQPNDGDGDGWRWDGERTVAAQGPIGANGSTVIRTDSDGHATTYTWDGTAYSSTEGGGAHDAITHDATNQQFVWTDGTTRLVERYAAVGPGRLASQQDVSGNKITFEYDTSSGRLTNVVDVNSGQRLVLTYGLVPGTDLTRLQKVETRTLTDDQAGKPTATVGAAVKQVDYGYDASGRLTSVKSDLTPADTGDALIFETTYTYDGDSGRVAKITHSDGTKFEFMYEAGRIMKATDGGGAQSFKYTTTGTGANATVSTDVTVNAGAGDQTWTYVSNANQQLIEIKSPPPTAGAARLSTKFEYDAGGNTEGNVRRIIDARGKFLEYEYDGSGNRKLERDNLGNTLLRTFDPNNQVVIETRHGLPDPDGTGTAQPGSPVTDRFVYDAQSRLRFAVSAEGVVTENRYGTTAPAVGLLTHTLLYAGGRYPVGPLTSQQKLIESQLTGWVVQQDKTKIELTEFTYDLRGQVSKQVDYATTNGTGGVLDASAVVTEFLYDGHGDLLKTIVVRGAARDRRTELATATYDGLGRPKKIIDSSGTTTTDYDDANSKIRVNTQAGLIATRSFDDRGRLVGHVKQAGTTGPSRATLMVYDGAGRLRMTEDPLGGRRFLFYDAADRVRFRVDAAGAVTGLEYNANDQLTKQTLYRNAATTSSWCDTAGKTVTKNALTVGGSGSDVVVDAANDRVVTYDYDDASRLIKSTDAAGTASDTAYDGRSLVSKQQSVNRAVQYFYDRDDRVVGTVDAMGFLTEYKYDGAGRLSETVRYNDRGTAATNIIGALATPLWVGVANQTVIGGRPFEYRMPAVDADTDTVAYKFVGAKPDWLEPVGTSGGVAVLRGTPPAAPASYSVVVQADDQRGQTSNVTVQISVVNKPPTWAPAPIQHLIAGQVFKLIVPEAFDPEGLALTYSVVSKPSWLTFAAGTRELSGTPTAVGFAVVELRATDPHGGFASLAVGLNIGNTSNNPPIWAQLPSASMIAASAPNYTPPAAQDPDSQFVSNYIAVSGLPAGLSVNSKNGSLVGTTKAVGTHSVVLRATDPLGASVDRTLSLEVRNAIPVYVGGLVDQTFDSAEVPSPFAFSMPDNAFADPNDDTLTYTAHGGPSWLTFDAQNLIFDGTVPAGQTNTQSFPITVTAHDGRGGTVSGSFSLTIRPLVTGFAAKPRQAAGIAPVDDVLATWRPSNAVGLHSYLFYDGQGRVTVAIDEKGFLTETLYDAAANKQQTLRYPIAVALVPSDTLTSIKSRAGTAKTISTVEYDDMGRAARVIGEDGTVTQTEYDAAGRAVRVIAASGAASATEVAESSGPRANRVRLNEFSEVTGTLSGVGDATLPASPTQAQVDTAITARGLRLESDSLGRKAKATDANGHASLLFYDRENRLTHTINAEREITETEYNSSGQPEAMRRYFNLITPANLAGLTGGPATQLQGKLPAQDQAEDQVTRFEYDKRGLLTKQTDPEGFITTRTYNQHGQLETETRTITQTPNKTVATRFDYDLRGALKAQTGDLGGINLHQRTSYDAQGRPVRMVDGAGNATTTTYPDGGRAIEVTDPLGRKVRTEYDTLGRVAKRIDASTPPATTTYSYDDAARKVTVTSPEGVVVTTRKTRHGEILDVTDGESGVTKYEYNKDGQLTKVIEPNGTPDGQVIRANTYDDSGRLETTTDGRGTVVQFDYDAIDRVRERRVDPAAENLTTAYKFNPLGQTVMVTEGKGTPAELVTSYDYDRNGRPLSIVVDPDGLKLSTTYTYVGLGDTVTIARGTLADPNQLVTTYEFDKLGRKIKQIEAPSAVLGTGAPGTRDLTTQYRYDAAGRLTRIIDALGNSTWTVYDAAGQVTHIINAEGEVTQNTYDASGRLTHTRRYLNRLTTKALNSLDDVVTTPNITAALVTNIGDQRSYLVYDKDGRLRFTLTADQDNKWVIAENRYDRNNNVIETRRYDKFLSDTRINAIDTTTSPGITVAEVNTELTATLNYTTEAALANIQRTRYAYHANNRLRFTVDSQGAVSENVYDPMGALVTSIRYAVKPTLDGYTQNAISSKLDRINAGNQVTHFSYDTHGRLRFTLRVAATDSTGKGTQHLVSEQRYDALGRPTESIQYNTTVEDLADYRAATIATAVAPHAKDRRQVSVYDTAGRQVYAVRVLAPGAAGKHLVVRTHHDALNRTTKRTEFATEMGLANLTQTTLDTAAVANTTARDRVTSFVYDAAGRQRFAIAPDGTLQETLYDAGGRTTEKRMFDLVVPTSTARTETALETLRGTRRVGDGVTRGERYSYDRVGRLETTTDAKGFHETSEYNGLGDRTGHVDKAGATCTYGYDRRGRVTRKAGHPVQVLVQLTEQSAPAVQEVSLEDRTTYDAFGNLKTAVERANTTDARTTDFSYDTVGRQASTFLPGFYDPATGKVEKTNSSGRFRRDVQLTYDSFGQVVRTRTRTGVSTSQSEYKTYDRLGQVAHDIDALNHVIAFTYTPFGEQFKVIQHRITVSGDPGNGSHWTVAEIAPKLTNDADKRTVIAHYDNAGRKEEVTHPTALYVHDDHSAKVNPTTAITVSTQAVSGYQFTAFGELRRESVKLHDTQIAITAHYYDLMGRETCTVDKLNHVTKQEYDVFGNLTRVVEHATPGATPTPETPPAVADSNDDRISKFTYNTLNQRDTVQRLGARYTQWNGTDYVAVNNARNVAVTMQTFTYDGAGRIRTQTDGLGNATRWDYNALGQLIGVTEPARAAVRPRSDASYDPFRSERSSSPITRLTLDSFGEVVKSTRTITGNDAADVVVSSRERDAAGNVIRAVDAEGNETLRHYDYAGRVIKERQPTSVTPPISASVAGWSSNQHTIERRYAYDATGRQTHTLDVFKEGTATTQSGVRSVFSPFGQVEEVRRVWGPAASDVASLGAGALVASHSYDAAGNMIATTAANGLTQLFYNLAGQVTRQEHRGNGTTVDGPVRITETGYDALGRAKIQRLPSFDARIGNATLLVTGLAEQDYDRWGNVKSSTTGRYVRNDNGDVGSDVVSTTIAAYNADNQLIREQLPAVQAVRADTSEYTANLSHELRYDLLGRVVQDIHLVGTTTLRTRSRRYSAAGQLISETDGTGITTQYSYDDLGRQVGVRNAVGTVRVDTFDDNGNILTHNVLRQADSDPYNSFTSTQSPTARALSRHLYDQAGRRFASVDVMGLGSERWSFTLYEERGFARTNLQPGATTICDYDAFGNKVLEHDTGGHHQTWTYSLDASDRTFGRCTATTAGSRTTAYSYTAFGEVKTETYGPADDNNKRGFEYHANGLVKQVHQEVSQATSSTTRFWQSDETCHYDYSVKGQLAKDTFTRTASYDIRRFVDGVWLTERVNSEQVTRTTSTTYDSLGRMRTVAVPGASEQPARDSFELTYRYDEFGNRRHVRATGSFLGQPSDKWFTYDVEGRVTIVDGSVESGKIVPRSTGTILTYDALGRRDTAERVAPPPRPGVVDDKSATDPNSNPNEPSEDRRWTNYNKQRYEYDDLNHLRRIHQQRSQRDVVTHSGGVVIKRDPPAPSSWALLDDRESDVLGAVFTAKTYTPIRSTGPGTYSSSTQATHTTTTYEADGQPNTETTTDLKDQDKNTVVDRVYDSGVLTGYTYLQGSFQDADSRFTDTYSYTYSDELGERKQTRIDVTSDRDDARPGASINTYDPAGRLVAQSIDLPDDSARFRSFANDVDGRILTKFESIPNGILKRGTQDFAYVKGQQVAMIGTGSLIGTDFSTVFTPISASYPAAAPSKYVVRDGDALTDIAQLVFGDATLWALIAEANSISHDPDQPLPATERGKTYHIPNAIATVHNNAQTFRPYNPDRIIGDDTPSVYIPPPPKPAWWEIALIVVVAIAVTVVVTYLTAGIGTGYWISVLAAGVGAAAGNAAGQAMTISMGYQDDFDTKSLLAAGLGGAAGAALGGLVQGAGLAARMVRGASTALGDVLGRGFAGEEISGTEALFNVSFGAASASWTNYLDREKYFDGSKYLYRDRYFQWGKGLSRLLGDAFNPQSGWLVRSKERTWQNVLRSAVGAFTSVTVGAGAKWAKERITSWLQGPRPNPGEDWITPRNNRRVDQRQAASWAQSFNASYANIAAEYGVDPSQIQFQSGPINPSIVYAENSNLLSFVPADGDLHEIVLRDGTYEVLKELDGTITLLQPVDDPTYRTIVVGERLDQITLGRLPDEATIDEALERLATEQPEVQGKSEGASNTPAAPRIGKSSAAAGKRQRKASRLANADPSRPNNYGSIGPYTAQPPAAYLRDANGEYVLDSDGQKIKLTENEHPMPKVKLQNITRHSVTGLPDYTDAHYERDTTLRWEREAALAKTVGMKDGRIIIGIHPESVTKFNGGAAIDYGLDVRDASLRAMWAAQEATGSVTTPMEAGRALLEQDGNLFSLQRLEQSGAIVRDIDNLVNDGSMMRNPDGEGLVRRLGPTTAAGLTGFVVWLLTEASVAWLNGKLPDPGQAAVGLVSTYVPEVGFVTAKKHDDLTVPIMMWGIAQAAPKLLPRLGIIGMIALAGYKYAGSRMDNLSPEARQDPNLAFEEAMDWAGGGGEAATSTGSLRPAVPLAPVMRKLAVDPRFVNAMRRETGRAWF